MEQQPNKKNMDNKPMEAEQVKKTRGRPKKAEQPTEKAPKETKPKAQPKETKPEAEPKQHGRPKQAKQPTAPKEQTPKAETKPKKDKHLKLENEEKELLHAQLKLKQFREAERQYKEAIQGLSKKKP